jgi:hypothetical protein
MATKYTKWPQNIPNGHKIFQMATKYTKWPQNIPNGHKIYQMATKYTKWPQNIPNGSKIYEYPPLQDPTKFTQIGIFGLIRAIWQPWYVDMCFLKGRFLLEIC